MKVFKMNNTEEILVKTKDAHYLITEDSYKVFKPTERPIFGPSTLVYERKEPLKVGDIRIGSEIEPSEDLTIISNDAERAVFQYYDGSWNFAGDSEVEMRPYDSYKILDLGTNY